MGNSKRRILLSNFALHVVFLAIAKTDALETLSNASIIHRDSGRNKRQVITSVNVCPKQRWQCRDGSCISVDDVCDGVPNCPDRSDETHALCRNLRCPANLFRCTYGACAPGHAACDGISQCADNSDELIPRCRSTKDEIDGQFVCLSGELIPAVYRCDGVVNCADGSDETVWACGSMLCPPHLFQCAYGACVNGGADCDGKVDCADGSDEAPDLCGKSPDVKVPTPRPNINQGGQCVLPPYPEHGSYRVVGLSSTRPGQVVNNPILEFTCHSDYGIDSASSSLYCEGGLWSGPMPRCLRQCTMEPDPSVSYECYGASASGGGASWPCRRSEAPGTSALPRCRDHFRPARTLRRANCVDGRWEDLASCVPECGTVVTEVEELMIGGRGAKRGELAWHAGIYRTADKEQICGGSLLRRRVVVSAAHCFWDKQAGRKMPASNFAVAVGKIHRAWSDRRDAEAQERKVTDIRIPQTFRGPETNFQEDIALVYVDRAFEYTAYIRPVCLDFDLQFDQEQLRPGNKGKVAGWGLTGPNGEPSEILRVVELPIVEKGECLDRAPLDFKAAITVDKICAGFYNGTALCQGDSGGGLAFPGQERGVVRYYLRGVVSSGHRNKERCNAKTVTTFTKITAHTLFFNTQLTDDI